MSVHGLRLYRGVYCWGSMCLAGWACWEAQSPVVMVWGERGQVEGEVVQVEKWWR